jgi:hypothetical protein
LITVRSLKMGMEKAILVPCTLFVSDYTADSTITISHPILTRIDLQMLKPKPIPLGLRDLPRSSLVKGLKRRYLSSGVIPMPSSETVKKS